MNKDTFYEVLEVSENASDEVIEKAYKVLAKKYHPDLQNESNRKNAENKMKKINEAYDVLGNKEKRKEYDNYLKQEREKEEQEKYNQLNYENKYDSANAEELQEQRLKYQEKLQKEEMKQRQKMQKHLNKEYENAYYNYLKNMGYKAKHKITKESIRDFFIVLGIMILIIAILWFIPPTHDWMVSFYEQNPILKTLIDIIVAIIVGIFTGIWNFITSFFQ